MVRTVLRFCAALRYPECRVLAAELTLEQFERGGAREKEMSYAQATPRSSAKRWRWAGPR